MKASWDSVAQNVHFTAPLNVAAFCERVALDAMILDLGCGYGRLASQLITLGFIHVSGYDASRKMIERGNALHPQLRLAVADVAKLPEPDGAADAVILSALLTSIPDPAKQRDVVKEIKRVLRPGGTVHGVEFLRQRGVAYQESGVFESKAGIAMWHFQAHELKQLFAGFSRWESWRQEAPSLSGATSEVLQFVVYAA
ncbi:MAG: class I SAM-dependent methyltransferase [Pseudomonadota bacterium]